MSVIKYTFLLFISINFLIVNTFAQSSEYTAAKNYFNSGLDFYSKLQLDSALNNFQKSSQIFKKNENWSNYLVCEYYSGEIMLNKGSFDFAQKIFENIETITNEKIGKNTEILAASYSSLGQIYFYKSDMGFALDYFDKALNINKEIKGDSCLEVSNLYNSLGNVYSQMGEYDVALENYTNDLNIKQKIYGENSTELATSYSNIAIFYSNIGQYDKSLELRLKVLKMVEQTGVENIQTAEAYSGIANIYIAKGEYDTAKEYLLKAIIIRKKLLGDKHFKIADDYINLGIIYENSDKLEEAEDYYFLALEIKIANFGETNPDIADIYNNLGIIAKKNKSYTNAIQYFEYALNVKKANYGDFNSDVAQIYTNIGTMYYDKGDYEAAKTNMQRAIDINYGVYGEKHPNLVEPYINLAYIFYDTKDDEQALLYFQKSIVANIIDFNTEDYTINPKLENYYNANKLLLSLEGKAKAFVGRYNNQNTVNDLISAFELYQLCDTLMGKIRQSTISKSDKISFGIKASEVYSDAISTCIIINKLIPEDDLYLKYAFYFSEKNKAGTLLEAISGAQAQKFAGIPDELLNEEKYLSNQIVYFEKQLADLTDISLEEFYRNQLFINNNKYRELIKSFENDYPKYFEMKYDNKTVTVEDIQEMLDDSSALRSYFISETNIYIFTITKNKIFSEISVKPVDIDNQILIFNTVITSAKSQNILLYQKLAFSFYKLLFPNEISENINRFWIIPDGILGTIPFEALFTEEYSGELKTFNKYPYLIKKYSISYSFSANLLFSTFNNSYEIARPEKDFLGIAPVFSSDNIMTFNGTQAIELLGTAKEVNNIKDNFTTRNFVSDAYLNKEASEAKLKYTKLTDYKFIHIATHGFVNSETPELSGLLLSKNQITGDDGILYTGEIYNLELNSDLVVMSACETGLGKISKGEGVIGLSRAILYAGAKNIIVSLWQVSDESTSILMEDFYNNILNNNLDFNTIVDLSDYLHDAKIKMIEANIYPHPYYWSSFILIGK